MTVTDTARTGVDAFVHPALFYRGGEEYVAGTVPFIRAGLHAGEPVAVAVPGTRLGMLRDSLGADAARVHMLDMTEAGRNPGRIIPGVLRAFADAHGTGPVRIIGEPIWPGRTGTEYPACVQHEALINLAFAGRNVTILCPYDADNLDPVVLADAYATHPLIIDRADHRPSRRYAPERIVAAYNRPLPPPPAGAAEFHFTLDNLAAARRFVAGQARRLHLAAERVDALILAVNELTTNSIVHGGGSGTIRLWGDDGTVVCETSDAGRLTDPLAGRVPVDLNREGGRGLLLVNHVSDLVRIHTADAGTAIRLYFR
jgi:anti-sigma regulatory factor (Ser/Thr protein kinase)